MMSQNDEAHSLHIFYYILYDLKYFYKYLCDLSPVFATTNVSGLKLPPLCFLKQSAQFLASYPCPLVLSLV